MRTAEQITEILVYWDASDPNNEGWAQRVTYEDGHQESDEATHDVATMDDLDVAVVAAAYAYGLTIENDSVAIDKSEGGSGIWTRDRGRGFEPDENGFFF